eukprot:1140667-Pelagomonas_calceolata.AAC.2
MQGRVIHREIAFAYMCIKLALVAHIHKFRGPLWGGRVSGGRALERSLNFSPTLPPLPPPRPYKFDSAERTGP